MRAMRMRPRFLIMSTLLLSIWLMFFTPNALSIAINNACDLPQDLKREIAAKFPHSRLVSLSDLDDDDRVFFQKDHGNACPGLVKVDFYGDGKPTLALVLLTSDRVKNRANLIVAHQLGKRWTMRILGTADAVPAPVVWSQTPGGYRDVHGGKEIRAARPVVIFNRYEAWAILYYWTGNSLRKIWLMD
jgi:hypothetical protein